MNIIPSPAQKKLLDNMRMRERVGKLIYHPFAGEFSSARALYKRGFLYRVAHAHGLGGYMLTLAGKRLGL